MLKSFKFRLRLTKKQEGILSAHLEECRWLYNYLLEQRKNAWEQGQQSLNYYAQATSLPALKQDRPSLSVVHSQVLQNVAVRIDLAFKAFFRRCKAGEKPGYPRFRGKERYGSLAYPQMGMGWKLDDKGLHLGKIGYLRMVQHRSLEGIPKTCTISRSATGKWFSCISCEVDPQLLPVSEDQVGIDVGLAHFATTSTGEQVENPRFFRADEKALAKAQHQKKKKVAARIHERIANRRKNFAHQLGRKLIDKYGVIAVEDLSVNRMVHNHCLAKSIHDAAWSQFISFLSYKAEWAGRKMVLVNPAYTSQDCSSCGHRTPKELNDRVHKCPCCGLVLDRDENAARNILSLGLQTLGLSPRSHAALVAVE